MYKIAAQTYNDLNPAEKIRFRLLVVDANRFGQDRTINENDIEPMPINPAEVPQLLNIHPGRLSVETVSGSKVLAQV